MAGNIPGSKPLMKSTTRGHGAKPAPCTGTHTLVGTSRSTRHTGASELAVLSRSVGCHVQAPRPPKTVDQPAKPAAMPPTVSSSPCWAPLHCHTDRRCAVVTQQRVLQRCTRAGAGSSRWGRLLLVKPPHCLWRVRGNERRLLRPPLLHLLPPCLLQAGQPTTQALIMRYSSQYPVVHSRLAATRGRVSVPPDRDRARQCTAGYGQVTPNITAATPRPSHNCTTMKVTPQQPTYRRTPHERPLPCPHPVAPTPYTGTSRFTPDAPPPSPPRHPLPPPAAAA